MSTINTPKRIRGIYRTTIKVRWSEKDRFQILGVRKGREGRINPHTVGQNN